jgi:hypothetical protein
VCQLSRLLQVNLMATSMTSAPPPRVLVSSGRRGKWFLVWTRIGMRMRAVLSLVG